MQSDIAMAMLFYGHCSCQTIELKLRLPHPLKCYAPRACDCDFCTTKGINWLSDPKGSLEIHCTKAPKMVRQGSQQADFISCAQCADVVAVTLDKGDVKLGAVNSTMLDNGQDCKEPQFASPQKLSAEVKARRWGKIWMPVTLSSI